MANPRDVGETLRQTREARQMTIEEVARRTHISLRYLEALEKGNLTDLPEPVYVRGFVKKYADLLELPAQELLSAYPSHPQDVPLVHVQSKPPEPSSGFNPVIGLVFVALTFGGAYWFAAPKVEVITTPGETETTSTPSPAMDASPSPLGITSTGSPSGSPNPRPLASESAVGASDVSPSASMLPDGIASSSQEPTPAPTGSLTPPPSAAPSPKPVPAATPKPTPKPSKKPAPAQRVTLKFKLNAESWLQVLVDGRNELEGLYPAGAQRSFSGRHVEITAGNGAGVRLYHNGDDLGIMGARGQVVTRNF